MGDGRMETGERRWGVNGLRGKGRGQRMETGEWIGETGDRKGENGDRRRENGEGRRENGEGRMEAFTYSYGVSFIKSRGEHNLQGFIFLGMQ